MVESMAVDWADMMEENSDVWRVEMKVVKSVADLELQMVASTVDLMAD